MLVNIWVTTECNMKCRYCYEENIERNKVMTLDTANNVFEYIGKLLPTKDGTLIINYHGGEPLISYGIVKFITEKIKVSYSNRTTGIYFGITTNGLLLNEEIIDYLCGNFSYSLSLSIDGDRTTHDANRILVGGDGTHDLILSNYKIILSKHPNARARMTVTPITVYNLFENIKFLIDFGFRNIVPVPNYLDKSWNRDTINCLYSQLQKVVDTFYLASHVIDNLRVGIIQDLSTLKKNGVCSAGTGTINIDPLGNIYPCAYTVGQEDYLMGNIDLGIIQEEVNKIRDLSLIQNDSCSGCTRYDYCSGTRCKLINNVMTGDYHKPSSVFCAIENVINEISKYHKKAVENM